MKEDIGKLVLRVAVGVMMLLHGVAKLRHGIDPIISGVKAHHLPTAFAYGVFLGEIVGPLLMIVGSGTRIGAGIVAFNMLVAVWLVHTGQLLSAGKGGGWALDLQGLYFFGALAVAFLGSGRYALSRGKGRFD